MKMAELSATTGVSVATIKYYLREGFLTPGERTLPNQATYTDDHVRRIRLIKSLIDVGGLSIAATGRVLGAIDSELPLANTFEIAQLTVSDKIDADAIAPEALASIDEIIAGWHLYPTNPGRLAAARVFATYFGIGQVDNRGWFNRYAAAALLAAEADLDEVETREGLASQAETVVVGTVLGDTLFAALRRAAQEHVTALRYGNLS